LASGRNHMVHRISRDPRSPAGLTSQFLAARVAHAMRHVPPSCEDGDDGIAIFASHRWTCRGGSEGGAVVPGRRFLLLMSCGGACGGGAGGNRWGRRAAVGPELARRRAPFWVNSRQFPVQQKEFPIKSKTIPSYCGDYFLQPIELSNKPEIDRMKFAVISRLYGDLGGAKGRRAPLRHRPQSRRPALPAPLRGRAHDFDRHYRRRRQCDVAVPAGRSLTGPGRTQSAPNRAGAVNVRSHACWARGAGTGRRRVAIGTRMPATVTIAPIAIIGIR
jgi:hypothetical protein